MEGGHTTTVIQLIAKLSKMNPDAKVMNLKQIRGYYECDFVEAFECIKNIGWRKKPDGTGEFLNATERHRTIQTKVPAVVIF
jgi:hypothetical protein